MCCELCGRGVNDGAELHRQNEKGVKGVWRCERCNTLPIDPEIRQIFDAIAGRPAPGKE